HRVLDDGPAQGALLDFLGVASREHRVCRRPRLERVHVGHAGGQATNDVGRQRTAHRDRIDHLASGIHVADDLRNGLVTRQVECLRLDEREHGPPRLSAADFAHHRADDGLLGALVVRGQFAVVLLISDDRGRGHGLAFLSTVSLARCGMRPRAGHFCCSGLVQAAVAVRHGHGYARPSSPSYWRTARPSPSLAPQVEHAGSARLDADRGVDLAWTCSLATGVGLASVIVVSDRTHWPSCFGSNAPAAEAPGLFFAFASAAAGSSAAMATTTRPSRKDVAIALWSRSRSAVEAEMSWPCRLATSDQGAAATSCRAASSCASVPAGDAGASGAPALARSI